MTDASSSQAGNANANQNHRVIVSLAFIPSSTAAPSLTASLTSDFNAHLPLTDLQWKSSSRGTQRTIERLALDFRPFASLLADDTAPKAQIPISLLSKPYLHILFIACDDNEVYRTTVRPDIRQWMDAVNRRAGANKSIEWIMVHVTSQKVGPKKFYQTKGSVFDKIRADFNHTKRDRVVQLPRPQSPNEAAILKSDVQKNSDEDQALWKEFLLKVKESIVSAFDTNFTSYEEDVRKVDAQRQMPGWNFCTFFIQKEGLAHSFEAMNLLEDALVQYDELEASYTLSARTSSLTWFKSLGGTSAGDECLSIFDPNSKPFRKLIGQNEITIFDFRIYLFGRQAALVCALGQITELAKRATPFIHSMAKMLRARDGALKPHFAEIWIYSACLDVIQKCNKMCTARKLNPAAQPDLLPLLAGLYEVAVRQLEKLGMHCGFLPRKHPFLMSANVIKDGPDNEQEENCAGNEGRQEIECAREDLKLAMKDQIGYDIKYRELLEKTLEAWNDSLRIRNAAKVKATIAAFEQCRQRHNQAENIYSTLHSGYSSSHWTAIESQLLVQSIHLQDSLSRPRDRLLSTLALVRTGLEVGSLTWTLGRAFSGQGELRSENEIAKDLMSTVRELSSGLEKDFAVMAFPVFETDIEEIHAGTLEEEEGVSVLVKVTNHLPTDLEIDEVRLKLVNTASEPLWLSSASNNPISLRPGKNVVQVTSLASVTGTYALDISQLRLSRTVFQYSHRTSLQRNLPLNKDILIATKQPIVVFGHDRRAVELDLQESGETYLDRPRDIILVISPGRSHFDKLVLRLQEPPGKISFLLSSVEAVNKGSCSIKAVDGTLEISDIESSESIRLKLPFEIFTQEAHATVPVQLEYTTKKRPEYKRQLRSTLRIRLALPLSVNVQDFLRDDFILSRFTVSADSAIPLRIQNAELQECAGLKAISARRKRTESLTIHRTSPATFIFRLCKDETSPSTNVSESRLRMDIKYRSYDYELQALLRDHISTISAKHDQTISKRMSKAIVTGILASNAALSVLDIANVEQFELGTFEEVIWKERLAVYWRSGAEWDALRSCLKEMYETPVPTALLADLPWHLLSIPFEVPSVAIYNRVSLELPSTLSFPLEVGEFIDVKIHITTSFRWANPAERRDMQALSSGQRMLYDISTRSNDWLINGRAKGEFHATEGSNNTVFLSLSPIRPGKLFVPSITVYPLPLPGQPVSMGGGYNTLPTCETFHENAATSVLVVQQDYGRSQTWIDRAEGTTHVAV